MKTKILSVLAITVLGAASLHAATVTWGGSSGEYTTGANWVGGSVPNTGAGDTAVINAGAVTYTPGGDLAINNGGVLQISGGSWTQAGGNAWIQLGGGTLLINGGTFNQGSAGNVNRNSTSSIQVSSGIANFNGNLIYEVPATGNFTLTGGTVNVASEFKPITAFSMTAGTLTANLISFSDGNNGINLSGGSLVVNGNAFGNGLYGGGLTKGINFSSTSTGSIFLSGMSMTTFNNTTWIADGTFQINGSVAFASDYGITDTGSGILVTLAAVPEPSTYALMAMGLGSLYFLRRKKIKA